VEGVERPESLGGVFINAYVDESGKISSDTMIVCGYVAPWSVWSGFQDVWDGLLRKHRIPYLHMNELMRWEGPYAELESAWGERGRDEVVLEFARNIEAALGHPFVRGVGVGIEPKNWNTLPLESRKKMGKTIDLFLFEHFIGFLLFRLQGIVDEDYRIGLTFDDRSDGAHLFTILAATKIAVPEAKTRIASLTLASDEIHIGLQAADLLNYFSREGYSGYLTDPNMVGSEVYSRLTARTNFKALLLNQQLLEAMANAAPISHLEFVRSEYLKQQPIDIVKS
jgi:hypothetical protein